ncbi:MAG: glycosyltransferase [Chloroflexi bacterium]|nr:glycosyltransferase [Chloroflexota bacterium]
MRIALISVHGCPVVRAGEKDTGGMNVYILETAREFARRGVCVDVYTRRHDPADPEVVELSPRARVIHIPSGPLSADKDGVYQLLDGFCRAVDDYKDRHELEYDVIWSHYWLSGLVGIDLKRQWGLPHVTSFHTLGELKRLAMPDELDPPERDASERLIMDAADRIVVWSENERDALRHVYDVPTGKISIIPPGVDSTRFAPGDQSASREALGIGGGRILLYVGRLERLKGVDIVLKALATMQDADDVGLLVVGGAENSPERERLRGISQESGISDRVRFIPSVDQYDLPGYYNAADVCVLPSYYESFGLAALEAAACGKPVVASKVGGLPSVVRDGETGFLVGWQCPGPFMEKLQILLSDAGLRRKMGAAARTHAVRLNWARAVTELAILFDTVRDVRATAGCGAAAG